MSFKIVALPGDGIGPEILSGTLSCLTELAQKFQFDYRVESYDIGGCAIDHYGQPLPDTTLKACQNADAILLGAIGGPQWQDPQCRPEQGLLKLRKSLNLYANIRPTRVTADMAHLSPLKPEIVQHTDLVIVRELTSGIYFGEPRFCHETDALDSLTYTKEEIARLAHVGFKLAQSRRKKVTSVDKENVLASSQLWRRTVNEVAQNYPDVEVEHLLVDACSMHLIKRPTDFDVIITENLFGDILSDEASMLPGSLGLSPSASFSDQGPKLYEPIHGSAPDIAGQNKANPFGMLLSLAMCLRESANQEEMAQVIERTVDALIAKGITTADLGGHYRTLDIFNHFKALIKEA
ncbi:3-isopropylmalate dehydrogenase [Staphylococcus lutrae]|uniref:3-isopropylmalate dehydrogenase n=1 Tax=Staphylococcus lutrae TaxID=155085 RepID=A0AAC9RSZ5_9STAP|nr:3-isopropylmalate dehydrogenase [Staphylococcus lutrae]ARJ50230.1 3-isopropylmalate dehydrogenase [Staphylococcus lutrae]PNZ39314.1 3-isopropylmalate dehydrogenase [Staphylococcus lutrae]